jgi:HEAT repeat protein
MRRATVAVLLAALAAAARGQDVETRFQGQTVAQWTARLDDREWTARVGAAYALGRLGPKARASVPALAEALTDEHPRVREEAARALGRVGVDARSAAFRLVNALKDRDAAVRAAAAEAAVQPLMGVLQQGEVEERVAAVRILGDIGPVAKAAVPLLVQALNDRFVRPAAADALKRIDPGAAARAGL